MIDLASVRRRYQQGRTTKTDIRWLIKRTRYLERALKEQLSDPGIRRVKQRRHAHDTEIAAAELVLPHSGTQRMDVLRFFIECGKQGATDEEMRAELDLRYSSGCARRQELVEAGWLRDSGMRRATDSGAMAKVWRLTPAAREWLRNNR